MSEIKFDFEKNYYLPNVFTKKINAQSKAEYKKNHMTHLLDNTIQSVYSACKIVRENDLIKDKAQKLTLQERREFTSQNKALVEKLTTFLNRKIDVAKGEKLQKIHGLFQGLRKWFVEKQAAFAHWRLHRKTAPLMRDIEETERLQKAEEHSKHHGNRL